MKVLGSAMGMGLTLILLSSGGTGAVTEIIKGADVRADPKTVKAILATFDRMEEALRTENLSGMMVLYSESYRHRGLRKEDTARIWENIFDRYNRLSSRHAFSRIVVEKQTIRKLFREPRAIAACTGALFGVSALKEGKPPSMAATTEPTHLDVWFETNHYLVLEDGVWKIIGHDPAAGEEDSLGAAIHLLF